MQLVKEAGGNAYNGLKMLVWQGVEAFELWNSVCVGRDQAEKIYQLLQEKTGI